jgi:hypothetical protein
MLRDSPAQGHSRTYASPPEVFFMPLREDDETLSRITTGNTGAPPRSFIKHPCRPDSSTLVAMAAGLTPAQARSMDERPDPYR